MASKNKSVKTATVQMQGLTVNNPVHDLRANNDNKNNNSSVNRQGATSRANDREAKSNNGNGRIRRNPFEYIHTRPQNRQDNKRGTSGTTVSLKANYFSLTPIKPSWAIYQYRIDFVPDVEDTAIRKYLLRQHRTMFHGYVFDGTMLFTATKLKEEVFQLTTSSKNDEKFNIKIKYIGNIPAEEALQVLNIIMRASMEGLQLQLIRRNYFDTDTNQIQKINNQLMLIPGYITSIRQHERNLLMCAELTSKVLRTETVYDVFANIVRNDRRGNQDVRTTFSKEMEGVIVMTNYNKKKSYRIHEIDWNASPLSKFSSGDKEISYKDYYQKRYSLTIRDLKQPLLLSRPTEKQKRGGKTDFVYLIPELCVPTGLTDNMRKDFMLMQDVAKFTRIGPAERVQRLLRMNERIRKAEGSKKVMNDWEISLDSKLIEFQGRELQPENILYGSQKREPAINGDWTRQQLNKEIFAKANLKNWVVIAPKQLERETQNFLSELNSSIKTIGLSFSPPKILYTQDERDQTVVQQLIVAKNNDPQLILVIVSKQQLYSTIKKFCCVQEGILSQIVTKRVITKPKGLRSICTKIGVQINCKLGAIPWMVQIPLDGMMFVGFDVCHDTTDKTKSFGAMVASMDMKKSMNYYSVVTPHKDGNELSSNIAINMQRCLNAYKTEHGVLPKHIIFYRDGVGEGQMKHVYDVEVTQLKSLFNQMYDESNMVSFTFVVVCKRINTRIFKGTNNPNAGTVVDDVITLPERYDFFLVSQSVTQGSASPTSYNVIYDSSKVLTPDRLQMLTYKLCHVYYNWTGTVRVPAVCQYAHKLSLLMGQYVHQRPSERLSKKLYFL
uniref:CSON014098 protein n=1 Tax=Culicoides sonorensis TaxID=179676 RepID=A0A336MFC3_CULSO